MNYHPALKTIFGVGLLLTPFASASAQTWDGNGDSNASGNWSTALNWNTDTVPSAGATVVLGDVTAGTRTVTFDSGNTIGTLNFSQTTIGAGNVLDFTTGATVTNAFTLAASGGSSTLSITPSSANVTLVASGGLAVGSGGALRLGATSGGFVSNITGAVELSSGGSITVVGVDTAGAKTRTLSSTYVQTGGSLLLENTGTNTDTRLQINGNTTITGGTINGNGGTRNSTIVLGGTTNQITGIGKTSNNIYFGLQASASQSLVTDDQSISAGALILRSSGNATKTISHLTGGTIEVGQLQFYQNVDGAKTALVMGSNMTLRSGGSNPFAIGGFSTGTVSFEIGLGGHVLDLTAGGLFSPNSNTGTTQWIFSSASPGGQIRATQFAFATNANQHTTVGSGVTLVATGNATSVLSDGSGTGAAGTIDAGSTFKFAGTGTGGLTSIRTIGGLTVASGTLRFVTTAITAAGNVTVGDSATAAALDLNGLGLTLSGASNLTGTGTVTGTGTAAFASGATGGVNAGNNGVGLLTFGSGVSLNLTNAGSSSFDIASAGTRGVAYDALTLNGNLTYGGALLFNITSVLGDGTNLDLFNLSSAPSGNFTSVSVAGSYVGALTYDGIGAWTGTIGGQSLTFTNSTGDLTISAIPEPSAYALSLGGLVLSLACLRRRRA